MSTKINNMTCGSPGKLILLFAIPLMLGNIFQQLYTLVDTMVVGQILGVSALAALGAAEWLLFMVLGILSGMTQGFSILIAQYYGAKDTRHLKRAIAYSYLLTAILAAAVLLISQLCVEKLLIFLNTPDNVIAMSLTYLRIVFLGIPVIAAYNVLASILRALGNSRSPLIAMIVAACINVVLDLLFVAVFHLGVSGAAIATVIAQGFSAIYCYCVLHGIEEARLRKEDFQPDCHLVFRLLYLGIPMAFQNMVIAIGGMVVQYVINGYGFLFVAGFTATNKLYGILELAATSYGYALTTYVGQNLGAGKYDRIKKGVGNGALMAILTSLVISVIMVLAGRFILSWFVSGDPVQVTQVLDIAYQYLFIMAVFLWILYLLHAYRSSIQGLGNTMIPLISGVIEFVMRVIVALFLPKLVGDQGIFFAEVCAWSGAAVLLIASYYWMMRHKASTSI